MRFYVMLLFATAMLILAFLLSLSDNEIVKFASFIPFLLGLPTVVKMLMLSFAGDGRKKKNN